MHDQSLRMLDFLRAALQERQVPRVDVEVFMKHLQAITDADKFARWNRLLTLHEQVLLGQMLRKDANAEVLITTLLESFRDKLTRHFAITTQEIEEFWKRFGLN